MRVRIDFNGMCSTCGGGGIGCESHWLWTVVSVVKVILQDILEVGGVLPTNGFLMIDTAESTTTASLTIEHTYDIDWWCYDECCFRSSCAGDVPRGYDSSTGASCYRMPVSCEFDRFRGDCRARSLRSEYKAILAMVRDKCDSDVDCKDCEWNSRCEIWTRPPWV